MAGKNLITKAEFKIYADINGDSLDTHIDKLIPRISQLVKTYCRSALVDYYDDPKVEEFSGGFQTLLLKEAPIQQVLSVETSADFGRTWEEIQEYDSWWLDLKNNCVVAVSPQGFVLQPRGYRVSYLAGYESAPEDLRLAVMDLVKYYLRNDGVAHTMKMPSPGAVQVEYITTNNFPAHIRRILDQYVVDFT